MTLAILWFRRDLRLDDLPALAAAANAAADGVVPLFVVDPSLVEPAGPNRRRFLAGTLRALDRELGGTLVLRRGRPDLVVPALAADVGATLVAATADFGPYGAARDRTVAASLAGAGRELCAVDSPYVVPPGTIRGAGGAPLRVFSAFKRARDRTGWEQAAKLPPARFVGAASDVTLEEIETGVAEPGRCGLPRWWNALPLAGARSLPPPGPAAAIDRLQQFTASGLASYSEHRDYPARGGTSGLSPYLHFGCIHPRTVLAALGNGPGADRMRDQLTWRDFYADVLWHRPDSARRALQPFGERLDWDTGPRARERFKAWATGTTGYPLVDAGMRQLLAEGWMHNRARMVTASFLVKDLHLDWRLGARWFMWHLVDGDLASNQHGWQWVAGTGTDAAPFHRVFNPHTQQRRFDPGDRYVRRYLGEPPVADDARARQDPPGSAGRNPDPIVNHADERREALARYHRARRESTAPHAKAR